MEFRLLKADEIECRVSTVSEKGVSLLLYKDARCDMNILDETVGALGWKREHSRDNANCIVSLWDKEKSQWVGKEDTGTESYAEKEKGLASDSFKRACFNWGIGRELYTAPFIWIPANKVELKKGKNGKETTYDKFSVVSIEYDNRRVSKLIIKNQKGVVVFDMGKKSAAKPSKEESGAELAFEEVQYLQNLIRETETSIETILAHYKVKNLHELTPDQYKEVVDRLNKKVA